MAAALAVGSLRQGLHELVRAYFDWLRDPAEQRRRRLSVQLWAEALRDERIAGVVSRGAPFRQALGQRFSVLEARRRIFLKTPIDRP